MGHIVFCRPAGNVGLEGLGATPSPLPSKRLRKEKKPPACSRGMMLYVETTIGRRTLPSQIFPEKSGTVQKSFRPPQKALQAGLHTKVERGENGWMTAAPRKSPLNCEGGMTGCAQLSFSGGCQHNSLKSTLLKFLTPPPHMPADNLWLPPPIALFFWCGFPAGEGSPLIGCCG